MVLGKVAENRSVRRVAGVVLQNELQVLAKAHVEHLVGFVDHDGFQCRNFQRPPLQMIAQTSRRADDDVHAVLQLAPLAAGVHPAHAGDHPRAGILIEPVQFALNLQRQLTRRRDDERERLARRSKCAGAFQ